MGFGDNDSLSVFVVADAHFGSTHRDQPTNEQIRDAMRHIYGRFPDLDMVWDAGDAHHNTDLDVARGEWLAYLAGEVHQKPLYYTAGNHELDNFNSPFDPEERASQLGSLTARPYYSLDIKNIHLIALPELIDVNYLSVEELAWLDLDLQLNQDKTVIIISHNALTGTTKTNANQIAYRRLANSDAILERMEKYKNIRAWIHGHNHTYEVVKQDDTLFVSAGRIGGFNGDRKTDLKLKADNLGGIYFEVTQNKLMLRAYNASKQAFMDELGHPSLSATLEFDTGLEPTSPASLSYGYGLARDGQRIPVYNHHLGATQRELFISGASGAIFSDNPQFTSYSQDTKRSKTLNAIAISPKESYEWLEPSVRLLPKAADKKKISVSLATKPAGKWAYYRAAPNHTYTATLKLNAAEGGQKVRFYAKLFDSDGNLVTTLPPEAQDLTKASQTLSYQFQVPELADYPSIYTDASSDRQLQLAVEAVFTKMAQPVTLEQFSLQMGDAETTAQPAIVVNDMRYEAEETLTADQSVHFDLSADIPQRSVFEAQANGNGLLTFLVRETDVQWQIRNAMATQQDDALMIGPMRRQFGAYQDIIVTPLNQQTQPYLNKLSGIDQAKVIYGRNKIDIELLDVDGETGELTIVADQKPRQVSGSNDWIFKDGQIDIVAAQNDRVVIDF